MHSDQEVRSTSEFRQRSATFRSNLLPSCLSNIHNLSGDTRELSAIFTQPEETYTYETKSLKKLNCLRLIRFKLSKF